MIKDRELCFIYEGSVTASTGGVQGSAIDLGPGGFRGRDSYVFIESLADTTATGSPTISFTLEFSDDAAFASPAAVPLSTPVLGKGDLAKGKVVLARAPLHGGRFVRLKMTASAAITCSKFTAGIILDPQTNS
ncbi:MAG: hypothetical protein LBR87_03055 [Synergistaceae bacterium]|jgi:hypothetical protein|nr:hypothetical protein [Synergistaceae bacterium]